MSRLINFYSLSSTGEFILGQQFFDLISVIREQKVDPLDSIDQSDVFEPLELILGDTKELVNLASIYSELPREILEEAFVLYNSLDKDLALYANYENQVNLETKEISGRLDFISFTLYEYGDYDDPNHFLIAWKRPDLGEYEDNDITAEVFGYYFCEEREAYLRIGSGYANFNMPTRQIKGEVFFRWHLLYASDFKVNINSSSDKPLNAVIIEDCEELSPDDYEIEGNSFCFAEDIEHARNLINKRNLKPFLNAPLSPKINQRVKRGH